MLDARLDPGRAGRWSRLGALAAGLFALGVLFSALPFAASGRAFASQPAASSDGKANSSASCASLKKKARRYKRGSAKRRRYARGYKKCRARARVPKGGNTPPSSAPTPPTSDLPAGPIYLPSIFPNPNGYRAGAGCLPGYNQTYIQAGFSCQYAGYNHNLGYPGSPVWTPVYLLFGMWYCADRQFRFRC